MDQKLLNEIIVVTESADKSANKVMEWLHYYQCSFSRKNVDSDFADFKIIIKNGVKTNFDKCVIWNRRGYMPLIPVNLRSSMWVDYLKREQYPVLSALEVLNKEGYKGSYSHEYLNNKINNLVTAANCGLDVPNTLVTNNKKDLFEFIEDGKQYITKCIYQDLSLKSGGVTYQGSGTNILDILNVQEIFAPSLVQERIEKEVELRVFYFEDIFFCMAIFSQQDEKTKLDFRNYNREKPNRTVPFLLPQSIKEKINQFILQTKCLTGSIDIILTPDGKFVFLEVNPMGQYDWVSESCNYYIDKHIAKKLKTNA